MNDTPHLEKYEWLHIWQENTNQSPEEEHKCKRILFIGYSITHGSYPKCKKFLLGDYTEHPLCLDYLTTSKGIDNPDIIWEIDYVTSRFRYDYIHFNNGLHGMGLTEEVFGNCYEQVVCHILDKYPASALGLMTVTPLTASGDPTVFRNEKVDKRNIAVKSIAEKYSLAVDDLYSVVMGKTDIRSEDGYHYLDSGYELLGRAMADFIISKL